MNNPLVSIIIPTFNRAHLISETLDSIVAQTYENWECIIVDDGSTDNTDEFIQSYLQDNRIKFIKRPDNLLKGGNSCRNYGFGISKGKYVKWFDSDDLMHPHFILKQVSFLEQNTDFDFCASLAKIFYHQAGDFEKDLNPSKTESSNILYDYIIGKLFFLTPSPLWRREFLLNKKLFDETLFRSQEADFHFRRLLENPKFAYLHETLFHVRRGHDSIDHQSDFDYKKIQSQLDYFDSIHIFLKQEKTMFNKEGNNSLQKYCILRKLDFFLKIRSLTNLLKRNNISNFLNLYEDVIRIKIDIFLKAKILIGITTVFLFNYGYRLIHIKEFDLRKR